MQKDRNGRQHVAFHPACWDDHRVVTPYNWDIRAGLMYMESHRDKPEDYKHGHSITATIVCWRDYEDCIDIEMRRGGDEEREEEEEDEEDEDEEEEDEDE